MMVEEKTMMKDDMVTKLAKMFSPHFGLNFQIAYNCKVFDDGIMYAVADEHGNYVDGNYLDNTRHSISFGVGVTF